MLDIHSHIIPGVDDGAKNLSESLKMIYMAIKGGTKTIIATPHYNRGIYEVSYSEQIKNLHDLKVEVVKKALDIEIILGQEVFLDHSVVELLESGEIGPISNTNYMLVETDIREYDKSILDYIYELRVRDITPILAHPERYIYIQNNPTILNEFVKEGCLFQVNGGSIKGLFGKDAKKTAEILINKGFCNFLGSDAHSTNKRNADLKEVIRQMQSINKNVYEKVIENGDLLLSNLTIEAEFEKLEKRKSFFSFFKRK
ncbi:tyrosine-protein phosphatase [Hathewaya histolytica]|uniref:tyrosine-protein phosphatase n=1 Tax=Hathewaya histolytica TaxID=1498 RepID=UPI003B67E2FA